MNLPIFYWRVSSIIIGTLRVNLTPHFRLFNWSRDKEFTIRIIHATNPQLAVVHVYYQGKMTAVAHTIGREQLPSEELVRIGLVAWGTFY